MDPRIIHQLDPTLHEKSRLSIASVLKEREVLSFIELKRLLGMTDGNLCVHIKTLERKGYLVTTKRRESGKTCTTCKLSDRGKEALNAYLDNLQTLLDAVRGTGRRRRRRRTELN